MVFSIQAIILAPLAVALLGMGGSSQSVKDVQNSSSSLLFAKPHHVEGQVVGEDGSPIAKVGVSHINLPGDFVSDSNGRFVLDTRAPAFVLQRPGFESALVRTSDASDAHIVLRQMPNRGSFPVCHEGSLSSKASEWRGIFQIPRTPGIKASREVLDVDYWSRTIDVNYQSAKLRVLQGRGGMWGGGEPDDELVWRSIRYTERTYDLGGQLLTDAKMWLPNGKCSRTVGVFGESLSYSDVDCNLSKPLDGLLDGLCVVPDVSKHLLQ